MADCWVVAMMLDSRRNASCLCILDAARIEAGPVAQLWLRHHVPHGLHGCWETETRSTDPTEVVRDARAARQLSRAPGRLFAYQGIVVYFSFCPVFEERQDIKTTVIRVDDPRTTVETRPNPNTNPNHTRITLTRLWKSRLREIVRWLSSPSPRSASLEKRASCGIRCMIRCRVPEDISSRRNLPEAASQSNPHHQGMPRGHAPSSRATTPADDHATSPLHAHAHSTRMSHESVWPRRS